MGWQDDPVVSEEELKEQWKLDPIVSDAELVSARLREERPGDIGKIGGLAAGAMVDESLLEKFNKQKETEAKYPGYTENAERLRGVLKQKYPQDYLPEIQQENMLKYAKKRLSQAAMPDVEAATVGFATSMASPLMRLYDPEKANIVQRLSGAYEQAAGERDKESVLPAIVKRGLRAVPQSVAPTLLAAGAGGPYAAYAMAAMQETDSALTRGADAGLSGRKLGEYALKQGAIEGGVGVIFQKIGLGGFENLAGGRQVIKAGIGNGLKAVGIATLQEVPEELATGLGHSIEDKLSGMDPNATSLSSLGQMAAETTIGTIFAMGFGGAPSIVKSYQLGKLNKIRGEILSLAANDETPSRKKWKQFGFDFDDGKTAEQRRFGIKVAAALVQSQETGQEVELPVTSEIAAEQQAVPFVQEATEVTPQAFPQVAEQAEPTWAPDTSAQLQVYDDPQWTAERGIPPVPKLLSGKIKGTHISSNLDSLSGGFVDRGGEKSLLGISIARSIKEEQTSPTTDEPKGKQGRAYVTVTGNGLDFNNPTHREFILKLMDSDSRNIVPNLRKLGVDWVNGWNTLNEDHEAAELHVLNPSVITIDRTEVRSLGELVSESKFDKQRDNKIKELQVEKKFLQNLEPGDVTSENTLRMSEIDKELNRLIGGATSTEAFSTEQQFIPFEQEATEQLLFEAPVELPSSTSIKKAVVNQLRAARGEGPVETVEGQSWEQWLEEANQLIENKSLIPEVLVEELNNNPRNASAVETAALQIHYNRLDGGYRAASERLFEAFTSGNAAEIDRAQGYANLLQAKLNATENAGTVATGTEWGRTGVARQMVLREDNSLEGLVRRSRVAKGGAELTPVEYEQIKKDAYEIAEIQEDLDKRIEEKELHQLEAGVDAEIIKSRPKKGFRKPTRRILEARAEAKAAWDDFSARLAGKTPTEFISEEKGALDPSALTSAIRLVKAYVNLGTTTFGEFYAHAKAHLGQKAEDAKEVLKSAWDTVRGEGGIPEPSIDPENARSVSRFAKKLVRSVAEAGTTDREEVVDLVYESLSEAIPGFTRRQTMEAIAGYGIYTELSKAESAVIQRDITGQLQQLLKLEDMKAGKAPPKTGLEHRTKSDTERQLEQQVNEAKRRGGYAVVDPTKQLKTAMDAAKTTVRHQIADMTAEIDKKEKNVKQRTKVESDEELIALRKKRDELRVAYDEMFPKHPMTDAQKAAVAEKAIDRVIAQLEADIKSGDIAKKKKPARITSPALEAKRAKLDGLRQQREAMRDILNLRLSPEEKQLATYKTSLLSRLSELDRRMAEGDFSKKARKPIALDKEATDLKFRLNEKKIEFKQREKKWQLSQATLARKAWHYTAQTLNTSRAIMTSFDFSAVFRQGAFPTFAHPIKALVNIEKMFQAAASKKSEFEIMEEIRNRPNFRLYTIGQLPLLTSSGQISKQEEDFMGEWAEHIPGVAASGRAYVAYLNLRRADTFDSMVASMGTNGMVTDMEARVIANFVAAWTGRANLGKAQAAAELLATTFFSPKYVVSRFQIITGRHMWGGNARTRIAIAKEYARSLRGIGIFLGLVFGLSKLLYPDEPLPTVQFDPRSSDFGKLRWGDKRLDFLGGIGQAIVLVARTITGKTKRATGEIVSLVGEDVPFGGDDLTDTFKQFLRGKLSPWLGATVDILTGMNAVYEPVTPVDVAVSSIMPLSFGDIYDAIRDEHIERGTAMSLVTMLGMSAQRYSNATPSDFAKKIAQHEKLSGINKKTKKTFDYSTEVSQVIAEAKRLGVSESEMISGLIEKGREEGKKSSTVQREISRLRQRLGASSK